MTPRSVVSHRASSSLSIASFRCDGGGGCAHAMFTSTVSTALKSKIGIPGDLLQLLLPILIRQLELVIFVVATSAL